MSKLRDAAEAIVDSHQKWVKDGETHALQISVEVFDALRAALAESSSTSATCPGPTLDGKCGHRYMDIPEPAPEPPPCPYGDPLCPCPDGDPCHYVDLPGSPAMASPESGDD